MKVTRRRFVANSCGLLLPLQSFLFPSAANLPANKKTLVLIHLAGGNDWFNTIIPYQCSDYYQSRPQLAIAPDTIRPLNNIFAFHPAMPAMEKLYEQGKVSILLNAGHDRPTLSHHRAIEIMQTGWLDSYAKLANRQLSENLAFPAINIEPFLPDKDQITVSNLSPDNGYIFDLDIHYRLDPRRHRCNPAAGSVNLTPTQDSAMVHSKNSFARGLNMIASSIKQKHNATIYNISLGGFDTHKNQANRHAYLLNTLSEGIVAFQSDLEKNGFADHVLIVVYSEFGRCLKENDDSGSDHGFTNHVLAIGNNVKGGVYGNCTYLDDARPNRYQFDFRQLYATILDQWLDCPSKYILGTKWQPIAFITDRLLYRLG